MATKTEKRAFLNQIKPFVIAAWSTSKVLPSVTAAQALLESDAGKSKLGQSPNNNLFGVKATGNEPFVVMPTQEYGSGGYYTIYAKFRTYDSWEDCINKRADFFLGSEWRKNNYRYVIGETDYKKATQALQNAGYATDPRYAKSLNDVIAAYGLYAWDKEIDKSEYEETSVINTEKMIEWFEVRLGKVGYSMAYRYGPNYYDCSSAVFSSMIYAGIRPQGSILGSTETLYSLEGSLLIPISFSEVQRGDIFVAGVKGGSGGAYGHTGVYYDDGKIIHCNYADNGISITGIAGRTGSPLHWYRIKGATYKKPKAPSSTTELIKEEKPIDIKSVNSGIDYIDNEDLINLFGIIGGTKQFEVDDANDLLIQSKEWLEEQLLSIYQFDLDAADLSLINKDFDELKLYNTYLISNQLLPINSKMRVVKRSFSLTNQAIKKLTFGSRFPTSTEYALDLVRNNNIDNKLSLLDKNLKNLQTVVSNTTASIIGG
ncbi:peptidoglycan amidohydrolase family protein [Globicatella sulfidifaciens]